MLALRETSWDSLSSQSLTFKSKEHCAAPFPMCDGEGCFGGAASKKRSAETTVPRKLSEGGVGGGVAVTVP